jgi:hypothetical protein
MKHLIIALILTFTVLGCTSNQSKKMSFEKGYVRFNNVDQIPNTIYHLRGKMELEIFSDFIIVKKEDGTFIIPSSHLVYAGDQEFRD